MSVQARNGPRSGPNKEWTEQGRAPQCSSAQRGNATLLKLMHCSSLHVWIKPKSVWNWEETDEWEWLGEIRGA